MNFVTSVRCCYELHKFRKMRILSFYCVHNFEIENVFTIDHQIRETRMMTLSTCCVIVICAVHIACIIMNETREPLKKCRVGKFKLSTVALNGSWKKTRFELKI